jgi:hypothetical protein
MVLRNKPLTNKLTFDIIKIKRGTPMYKIFLYTSVFSLLFFIIWVGVETIHIKVVLGVIGLTFLIPKVRKKLYKARLLIRKSIVALYTSLILTCLSFIFVFKEVLTKSDFELTNFMLIFAIFLYSALGNFIYGIPVSLFSDLVTANLKKFRIYSSFLIHIGFGLLTCFFIGPGMIFAALCSLIFFLIDEFLRKRDYSPYEI